MSRALESSAEILKLGHQLGVPPVRLDFLTDVDAGDLRALRAQIAHAMFTADKHHFSKVAAIARLVPVALAAKITEFALSPLIAARTAELLEPPRASEMVVRLSDRYLADVSAAIDPARASAVIANIPPATVATVGSELARRGEWVVMGGFVSVVSPEALTASVTVLNGEQLLRIGFVLDDLTRLDDIARILTDEQLDQMLAAAAEQQLWDELDELMANLSAEEAARVAARYAHADQGTVAAFDAAADAGSLSAATAGKLTSP